MVDDLAFDNNQILFGESNHVPDHLTANVMTLAKKNGLVSDYETKTIFKN